MSSFKLTNFFFGVYVYKRFFVFVDVILIFMVLGCFTQFKCKTYGKDQYMKHISVTRNLPIETLSNHFIKLIVTLYGHIIKCIETLEVSLYLYIETPISVIIIGSYNRWKSIMWHNIWDAYRRHNHISFETPPVVKIRYYGSHLCDAFIWHRNS